MQEKKFPSITSIRYIKGVGPKKSIIFNRIGIESVEDAFYYLPARYEDRTKIVCIKDIVTGVEQGVIATVSKKNLFRARTGTTIFEMVFKDATGLMKCVWYNMPFLNKGFNEGQKVLLYGKAEVDSIPQFTHPVYEIIDDDKWKMEDSLEAGRIVPVYSLTRDLSQKFMRKTMFNAISSYSFDTEDIIPAGIMAREKIVDFKFALRNIHFPFSYSNLERAYERLVFEEFFILQISMALRRRKNSKDGITHKRQDGLLREFEKLFDFELTRDQKRCIEEIEKDMSSARSMTRLLQGDVGSGKTVVAMYAVILSYSGGFQSCVMAPTEILARQHFVTLSKILMPLGLNLRLLVGGIDTAQRKEILDEIESGACDVVVGTHSCFQEDVKYKNLGLIVIDEQHKFGVRQIELLKKKNIKADTLIMTATPIPRSLALTVYGDMDFSSIRSKPSGRGEVITCLVSSERRDNVYAFIKEEVKKGRQAFIVCPKIHKNECSGVYSSAKELFDYLKSDIFKDIKIGLIHASLKEDEKINVMEAFVKGKLSVLVSTTIIEVGVDIPNVTVMVIEEASSYGLAQLHQLRGRIGRGVHRSYCVMISDADSDHQDERLSAIQSTDDGFKIAEKDLDIRGPGEFFGTRQSGIPELKVGDIVRDFKIMERARIEAFKVISEDPRLKDERNRGIRRSILSRYRGKVEI